MEVGAWRGEGEGSGRDRVRSEGLFYEMHKVPLLNVKGTDSERLSSLAPAPPRPGPHARDPTPGACLPGEPFPPPRGETAPLPAARNTRPVRSCQLLTSIAWSLPKECSQPSQEQGAVLLAALSAEAFLQAGKPRQLPQL